MLFFSSLFLREIKRGRVRAMEMSAVSKRKSKAEEEEKPETEGYGYYGAWLEDCHDKIKEAVMSVAQGELSIPSKLLVHILHELASELSQICTIHDLNLDKESED